MNNYPIVRVDTADGLGLHGMISVPENQTRTIVINIHGSASNFYHEHFYPALTASITKLGVSFLSTNNRGSGVYDIEKGYVATGASLEKFEDSVLDIDAWIEFSLQNGYENIILEGHSFGTEKIVYYMSHGKYIDSVSALILLGFSDSVGNQQRYEASINKSYFDEASNLMKNGSGETLLSDRYANAGELPISAMTYLNFFADGSELSKTLPLRNGTNLEIFKKIHVPIFCVISDNENEEYTQIPIKDALALMKNENPMAESAQIPDTNHCFESKENELAMIVSNFIKRHTSLI
ncbi:MAG: DUF1749 domain-containing protein [bacterium]